MCLADAQTGLGDIATAARNYREVLRHQPLHAQAWFSLADLKTEPLTLQDAKHLRRALASSAVGTDDRIQLGFALAKALEDQGDFAAAFEALQQANALKRRSVPWDAAVERVHVNAIMTAFARPASATPLDPTLGTEVIFIVSLPRSGSTLIEQILASHPSVEGANEITDLPQVIDDESKRLGRPFPQWVADATAEDWARLGRDYLVRTARWRRTRPRFTNKNLITWQLVGAIRAMLPGARIVSCRRDPLETCFACYRQLFSNGAYFSYDPRDMVMHYQDYERLVRHWLAQFPQHVFDFSYDELLPDPEARICQLQDFCDLEFDAACLNPHQTIRTVRSTPSAAQVRQPLGARSSYSTRYGELLRPFLARLDIGAAV